MYSNLVRFFFTPVYNFFVVMDQLHVYCFLRNIFIFCWLTHKQVFFKHLDRISDEYRISDLVRKIFRSISYKALFLLFTSERMIGL